MWIERTLMLPTMSFLTGVKATEPRRSDKRKSHQQKLESSVLDHRPNSVVVDSAASRNSPVGIPLSLGSIGTSWNDVLWVSNQV